MDGNLTYTLEQSETENGSYIIIGIVNVPTSNTKINATYYYKLTIKLNNLDVNQNSDLNASFSSQFEVEAGTFTGVIAKESPQGSTCTTTLAYDGTVDNNLRYVGINPFIID